MLILNPEITEDSQRAGVLSRSLSFLFSANSALKDNLNGNDF